ncbi:MAG TPA: S-layer homology domain-containing protein [Chloroflexia bacterium]|jgi:hypothetical protein
MGTIKNVAGPGSETKQGSKPHLRYLSLAVLATVAVLLLWSAGGPGTPVSAQTRAHALAASPAGATATPTSDCTGTWDSENSSNAAGTYDTLNDVTAVSANDVWAVGNRSTSNVSQTLTQHWNGAKWETVPSPNVDAGVNMLYKVWARASNDVWAVGRSGPNDAARTLAMHWNGSSWQVIASPNVGTGANYLLDVSAVSANDVWAVGSYSIDNVPHALIVHWNGTNWQVASNPNVGSGSSSLSGVWAISSNDVWAVGFYQAQTLIEHWNGTSWQVVPSPSPGTTYSTLASVSASTPSDVWAVGTYKSSMPGSSTLIEHWDGSSWQVVPSPNPQDLMNTHLVDVFAVSPTNVWAVGNADNFSRMFALVQHWNGTNWQMVSSANDDPDETWAFHRLDGVWAASYDQVWVVGGYSGGEQPAQTVRKRYDSPPGDPCGSPPPPSATPTATPIPGSCTIQFADVPASGEGSTYYAFARCLVCKGIVSGYPCGGPGEPCNPGSEPYYRPGTNVTRGQLSKIIASSAGLNGPVPAGQQQFADVAPGSPFYEYAERLAETGAISGYPCGGPGETCDGESRPYFRPNNPATRGQISKIVSIAADFSEDIPSDQQSFTDVPSGSPFWVYIERLSSRGVISGYGDDSKCPGTGAPCFRYNDNTTRGQMAKIAANAFFPNCEATARK